MGGARHYWQNARLLASCATILKHLIRDEVAPLEAFQNSTGFRCAAQPPMHFRTIPLAPAPDYSMLELLTSRTDLVGFQLRCRLAGNNRNGSGLRQVLASPTACPGGVGLT